ncbi:hypothetical protein MOQ_002499 [Trypanosoma cruzi marinkellei]|uniref:Uncharacterized protein n=1 Tax=Trypanosoma cruzi marinkellei TaxID=85056 RepID=K2N6T3_TRYCR|nr:hypothetical protein MOQ_002499 [Trypanosoma cruzi marinkellei]
MAFPLEIAVGERLLTLSTVSRSTDIGDKGKQPLSSFYFVGERLPGGDIQWFLSPLDGYEQKRLRVEEAVVEKDAGNRDVFLRLGESTFRQYTVKGSPSRIQAVVTTRIRPEEHNESSANSRQSSYFLSSSSATPSLVSQPGTHETSLIVPGKDANLYDGLERRSVRVTLRLPINEVDGWKENLTRQEVEGEKCAEVNLPPVRVPQKPATRMNSNVRPTGSIHLRRLLGGQ